MSGPTDQNPTVEQIEADIARNRAALAGTVDELSGRLDVKARVRDRVSETPNAILGRAAVGAVALVVLLVWWRRRS